MRVYRGHMAHKCRRNITGSRSALFDYSDDQYREVGQCPPICLRVIFGWTPIRRTHSSSYLNRSRSSMSCHITVCSDRSLPKNGANYFVINEQ
jgi:hypothetical protein